MLRQKMSINAGLGAALETGANVRALLGTCRHLKDGGPVYQAIAVREGKGQAAY
jgi:hypothetical protein